MESTGSYWKPVVNLLEMHVRVILANAADVQNRRGAQDRSEYVLTAAVAGVLLGSERAAAGRAEGYEKKTAYRNVRVSAKSSSGDMIFRRVIARPEILLQRSRTLDTRFSIHARCARSEKRKQFRGFHMQYAAIII